MPLSHNFTFRNHLLCLCLCVCDDRICFGLCVCQDRIFVADDLLVTFDLIRCLHTKLTQKLFQFFFIYHDLCRREWLEFTTVYILLDFFNNLLNSVCSSLSLLFFILISGSSSNLKMPYGLFCTSHFLNPALTLPFFDISSQSPTPAQIWRYRHGSWRSL